MQPLFFDLLPWSYLQYNFKILPEHQLQNLKQTLKPYPQSPNKNLTLWPKLIFQICTKLLSTCFSSSTSTTVTTSTSFELPSSHARVTSIKFTKQESVNESVSEWVTDKHSQLQWSDSGPIKTGWRRDGNFQNFFFHSNLNRRVKVAILNARSEGCNIFNCRNRILNTSWSCKQLFYLV